ncbi:uncharacterized protein METZ01_LOCUS234577, partial [marine metagenome]
VAFAQDGETFPFADGGGMGIRGACRDNDGL